MEEGIRAMQELPSGHGMVREAKQERVWSLQHVGDTGSGLRGAQGTGLSKQSLGKQSTSKNNECYTPLSNMTLIAICFD